MAEGTVQIAMGDDSIPIRRLTWTRPCSWCPRHLTRCSHLRRAFSGPWGAGLRPDPSARWGGCSVFPKIAAGAGSDA